MTIQKTLSLPLIALLLHQPCLADLFPNGDFETGGTSWEEVGSATFTYPATEGNPDGYGIIDHSAGGGFAIWVTNDGTPIPLADLALTPGNTYNFTQDMRIFSGSNIGGFKIEFYDAAGGLVNLPSEDYPTLIGDGSTWETYTFETDIPATAITLKAVPLWAPDSSVGFDNIGFDPTPVLPPIEPPVIEPNSETLLTQGTLVTWVPTNPEKIYQPQSSQDEVTWTNLGPAFLGTDTTTVLDPTSAPFHRVQEQEPAGDQALINGDFEIADLANPDCPENWSGCILTEARTVARIETDSFSGTASMRLAIQNDDGAEPRTVSLQHDQGLAGGFVTPGESYTFSFMAKQISSGVSYVQGYKIVWFDADRFPVGTEVGPTNFTGGSGTWTEHSTSNIVAPASAASVLLEFFSTTGAVAGSDAKGEVLLDNIRLAIGDPIAPTNLATTTEPGIGVSALTQSGVTYKAQESEDLETFTDLTGTFTGNGKIVGAGIPDGGPSHFFRILEITPAEN